MAWAAVVALAGPGLGACADDADAEADVAAPGTSDVAFDNGGSSDAAVGDTGAVQGDAGQAADGGPIWPDTDGCKPNCVTVGGKPKVCGDDGCGSVCGFCLAGDFCSPDHTSCGEHCKAKCDGKKCGDDGCGGKCGICDTGYSCGKDDLCHADDCKAACGKHVCGDDGCGGSCGDCAEGDLCDPLGQCKPGPCKGIPASGQCDGAILLACAGSGASATKTLVDCGAKGLVCDWDAKAGAFACIVKPPCTPTCKTSAGAAKECGSDGCEGICGKCPGGWSCPGGFCKPEKGADCGLLLTAQGKCADEEWIFCSGGKVAIIDCAKVGQKCAWITAASKFGCQ